MVFLHDVLRGSPERAFLERWLPATLYSDEPRFAGVAHVLDAAAADIPEPRRWRGHGPAAGYGYSLACLQHSPQAAYRRAWIAAAWAGLAHRGRG
jgi:hypothetical protein